MSTVSLQDYSLSFNDEAEENSESLLHPSCLIDEPSLSEGNNIAATNTDSLKTNDKGEKKRVEVSCMEVSLCILFLSSLNHFDPIYPIFWVFSQGQCMLDSLDD